MNAYRDRHYAVSAVAFVVASLISIGTLAAVSALFQIRGLPLDELAAAERACAEHRYVSEREACVHAWLAARGLRLAHR